MPEQKTLSQFNKDMYTDLFGDTNKGISDPLDGRVPDFVFGDIFTEPTVMKVKKAKK